MIDPKLDDIGRRVVTFAKWGDQLWPADGELMAFDSEAVFVTFGGDPIMLHRREADWADVKVEPEIECTTTIVPNDDVHEWPVDDLTLLLPFDR